MKGERTAAAAAVDVVVNAEIARLRPIADAVELAAFRAGATVSEARAAKNAVISTDIKARRLRYAAIRKAKK
ncbi:hypothetical protein [Arthrobacter sp. efr-133-R2A-120]|uniref:hypothetical protein n=1 Tax=Arthrobacter sp. efr-133-R2A-120 TaxID=3040277 RepID=UPI0025513463|nr:hypothetical protein [Arthrobacter sp. efr-133-R2A-120]